MIHPTMKYYPLRPELAESTFYLYQATKGFCFCLFSCLTLNVYYVKYQIRGTLPLTINIYFFPLFLLFADPWYLDVGETIVKSLNLYTKVPGGFASVRDVTTMQLEDHQHSFFLAET